MPKNFKIIFTRQNIKLGKFDKYRLAKEELYSNGDDFDTVTVRFRPRSQQKTGFKDLVLLLFRIGTER